LAIVAFSIHEGPNKNINKFGGIFRGGLTTVRGKLFRKLFDIFSLKGYECFETYFV
jgi:hypothetical protein